MNPSEDKQGELIQRAEKLLAKHGDGTEWFPTDGDDSFDVLNMAQELLDALKESASSATTPTSSDNSPERT